MSFETGFRYFVCFILVIYAGFTNLVPHLGSICLLILTLCGLPYCFSPQRRPSISKGEKAVFIAIAAFVFIYVMSFVINGLLGNLKDPRPSYIDHRMRLLAFIPVFILFRRVNLKPSILWIAMCLGATTSGFYAIAEALQHPSVARVTGSYHAIAFGDLAISLAFLSYFGINAFFLKRKPLILVPLICSILGLLASILSGTKGAWIAIPAFLIIAFFHNKKRGLLLGFVFIILVFTSLQSPDNIFSTRVKATVIEFNNHLNGIKNPGSVSARLEGWKASLLIFKENPLFGAGVGNFKSEVLRMVDENEINSNISGYNQPHNLFLYVLAECGIMGFMAVVGVFVVPFGVFIYRLRTKLTERDIVFAGMVHIISFAHFGMTEAFFGRNALLTFFVIVMAATLALSRENPPGIGQSLQSKSQNL